MKSVDSGKEKVKKICEVLREETLAPARKEGDLLVANARAEAEKIIRDAKSEAARIEKEAKKKIEEERNVFRASINLAAKKTINTLKEKVESGLFSRELSALINTKLDKPEVVARLIDAVIVGIEKEGAQGDLQVAVSPSIDVDAVTKELAQQAVARLKGSTLEIGEIEGGAQVKIVDQNLTIDMSDEAFKELLARFVRDDFRSMIFAADV